ncbi:hypothetical protein V8G54_004285 [Vigna mungo]|uniref:Uncharacterized protein n=1 Tax=Vigna mungo TaxID=3915 RepID=A0AAQ3SEY2_VIGMU
MKLRILSNATSSVCSLIFAKQTLNQPGSEQRHEDPGEMLSFTSCKKAFQSSSSPSLFAFSNSGLRFIQQNSPAFPFKHSMPTLLKPSMIIWYLFLSLSLLVPM